MNFLIRIILFTTTAFVMLLLVGCSNSLTGYSYTGDQALRLQTVDYGYIVRLTNVKIDSSKNDNGVGTVGGAVAGGALGSTVGNGSGISTISGLLIGGLIGHELQKKLAVKSGINIFVTLCSGKTISVVQSIDKKHPLRIGDPVIVLSSRNKTRIIYDDQKNCKKDHSQNSERSDHNENKKPLRKQGQCNEKKQPRNNK